MPEGIYNQTDETNTVIEFMCDGCERLLTEVPAKNHNVYTIGDDDVWSTCRACAATERDHIIRTPERLDKGGPRAWPGGYPLAFMPVGKHGDNGGIVLCFDCARETLAQIVDTSEDAIGTDHIGIMAELEDSDTASYGGLVCDCGAWIVEPECPDCGDSLLASRPEDAPETHSNGLPAYSYVPSLRADNVDASQLCRNCAAHAVYRHRLAHCGESWVHPSDVSGTHARHIPGIGIEIVAVPSQFRRYPSDDGLPWFAPAGTVYRYR